jgi:hypothetical protein
MRKWVVRYSARINFNIFIVWLCINSRDKPVHRSPTCQCIQHWLRTASYIPLQWLLTHLDTFEDENDDDSAFSRVAGKEKQITWLYGLQIYVFVLFVLFSLDWLIDWLIVSSWAKSGNYIIICFCRPPPLTSPPPHLSKKQCVSAHVGACLLCYPGNTLFSQPLEPPNGAERYTNPQIICFYVE